MRTWEEICEDRTLQDLPYKIETNRFNQIVTSPTSNCHGGFQSEIARKLADALPGGRVITECAVETSDGVKVPDVAWVSTDRLQPHRRSASMPIAPEICVEIRSYSNSVVEMMGKMQLYFARGAEEVWFCDENGNLVFYRHDEPAATNSKLCPSFPVKFEW
jgi:Uma2 family endonuclease